MIDSGFFICGGTIIGPTYVITAGHCTFEITAENIQIRAGSSLLSSGGILVQVKSFENHPEYRHGTFNYDLAILILDTALPTSNPGIKAIELPDRDETIGMNDIARISGWGTTRIGGKAQENLQYVDISVVEWELCHKIYSAGRITITRQMVCAGNIESDGNGACQGDSGGPMVVNHKLFGAVSFGIGCGNRVIPQVFTSIANNAIRDWIDLIICF